MDCTLPAKVDWQSGKVAADDNGIFSPRLEGPLYMIGTRWLALNPVLNTPVPGILDCLIEHINDCVNICNTPLDKVS